MITDWKEIEWDRLGIESKRIRDSAFENRFPKLLYCCVRYGELKALANIILKEHPNMFNLVEYQVDPEEDGWREISPTSTVEIHDISLTGSALFAINTYEGHAGGAGSAQRRHCATVGLSREAAGAIYHLLDQRNISAQHQALEDRALKENGLDYESVRLAREACLEKHGLGEAYMKTRIESTRARIEKKQQRRLKENGLDNETLWRKMQDLLRLLCEAPDPLDAPNPFETPPES